MVLRVVVVSVRVVRIVRFGAFLMMDQIHFTEGALGVLFVFLNPVNEVAHIAEPDIVGRLADVYGGLERFASAWDALAWDGWSVRVVTCVVMDQIHFTEGACGVFFVFLNPVNEIAHIAEPDIVGRLADVDGGLERFAAAWDALAWDGWSVRVVTCVVMDQIHFTEGACGVFFVFLNPVDEIAHTAQPAIVGRLADVDGGLERFAAAWEDRKSVV